jgi:hypothetical protein
MANDPNPLHSWLSRSIASAVSQLKDLKAEAVRQPPLQRLEPAMEWDWAPTVEGIIGAAPYHFYDSMPASCAPEALYVSTGDSFSGDYFAFLELLRSDFQPEQLLVQARSAAVRPQSDPASSPSPRGWTKMQSATNLIQWAPDWSPAQTPQGWLQSVSAGREFPARSFTLDPRMEFSGGETPATFSLVQARIGTGARQPLMLEHGELMGLSFSAQAWGRVPISPGDWYKSGLVTLARNGPFVGGYTRNQVFGPTGLLRCRVAEMVLAYKPSLQTRVSPNFATRHDATLAAATELSVGGILIKGTDQQPGLVRRQDDSSTSVVLEGTTTSEAPLIVAVMLETFD